MVISSNATGGIGIPFYHEPFDGVSAMAHND
jgi:hypothetical protein